MPLLDKREYGNPESAPQSIARSTRAFWSQSPAADVIGLPGIPASCRSPPARSALDLRQPALRQRLAASLAPPLGADLRRRLELFGLLHGGARRSGRAPGDGR